MRCSKCGTNNPPDNNFCAQCGNALVRICVKCGAQSSPASHFCGRCGTRLDAAAPISAQTESRVRSSAGERRHLTVLFCDLVDSTRIAAQLDPEEWGEIVADYHRIAAQAIERFGGHVAQYLGDGVMAYFGWPEAHDNNAERAARAGLAILDAISKLNEHATQPKLTVRVGIDSGAVVVGVSAGKGAEVFGDTPNIAARVQAAAPPGTVLITADTHRLMLGLFVVEDRGKQILKGIEQPIQLYRVIRPSDARGRLQAAAAARALTPFIGRDDELRLLMSRWERALESEGQVVLISGEGGIGKSRLVQRFHQQIAGRPYHWAEGAASPFFQNTPFYPVAEMFRELLAQHGSETGQVSETSLEQRHRRRTGPIGTNGSNGHPRNGAFSGKEEQQGQSAPSLQLDLTPQLAVAQVALNLPVPAEQAALPLRRLLSMLAEWVLGTAQVVPLVIVIEDLHWADASTLELIQLLVEQAATAPLLLLCTARPEFRIQWPPQAHLTQITLNPLSMHNTRMMLQQVAGQKALTEETAATVVERTGGVPLFIEELTRAVLESGDSQLAGRKIPATLHDSLMARLDRLGPAKEVIQIGAVIGSEFSHSLLHAVHPIAGEAIQEALGSLIDAQLLYVSGTAPDVIYRFKHSLIRDAAYEALLKSRRRDLHRRVARVIDEKFSVLKEAHPELLARHWREAGETERAIVEWSRAGKNAQSRKACREALESYRQALDLLFLLPSSSERERQELELRELVVSMLIVTSGFSASETIDAAEEAAALAEKSGNLFHHVNLMVSRGYIALASGDFPAAGSLANQALELAARHSNAVGLGSACALQIQTCYWRGDLAGVENYFTMGREVFNSPAVSKLRGGGAPAFGPASWNAWILGRADVARERIVKMLATVNENDPYDAAYAAVAEGHLRVYIREYERAEQLATRALELCEKHQFSLLAALSRCLLGHARAQLGNASQGIGLIRRAIDDWLELGSHLGFSHYPAYLAAAQERADTIADAFETIELALQANPDELVCRPETLRIRGELQLRRGQAKLAETDFREALSLARSIEAKAWELRVSVSLARLLEHQKRRNEARLQLAEIYNWFTEGFDTADLKEAKALLDQLGKPS